MGKKIVGIGGGEIKGWSFKTKDEKQDLYETQRIDYEIVKLSNKKEPQIIIYRNSHKRKSNIL